MNSAPLSPVSALVAHVESLITDRRVLVVGNAERSVAEHLLARGARLVQVLDPDPRRVSHAAAHNSERRVTYAQLTESSLRDGSFDVALVEDVELADDLSTLTRGLRRSLSNRGIALICCQNADVSTGLLGANRGAINYDSFYDTVEEHFDSVIMLGQSPFLGYSVVQFGLEQAPEPALDNAYLDGESDPADFYIALCGSDEVLSDLDLEDMSIVQLSAARFVSDNESSHRDREMRAARRAESLENEVKSLRARQSDDESDRLRAELEEKDSWIKQLESRAESADARADDAQAGVDELEQELEDTHSALLNTREDADRAVKERDESLRRNKKLMTELDELKQKPQISAIDQDELDALDADLEEAEAKLKSTSAELKKSTQSLTAAQKDLELAQGELKQTQKELKEAQKLLKKHEKDLKHARDDAAKKDKLLATSEEDLKNAEDDLAISLKRQKEQEKSLALAKKEAKEGEHHSVGREALEEEITLLDKKNKSLEATFADKQRGLERLEKRLVEQEKELDDLHAELDETEEQLIAAKKQIGESSGPDLEDIEKDVRGLEAQLKQRGKRITELESQLRNLELYAKTLKADLQLEEESENAPAAELEALARALAEREADLVAAEWTIGQLKLSGAKS